MKKSIEALLRGYIYFRVRVYDGVVMTHWFFWTYENAKRFKDLMTEDKIIPDRGNIISLEGRHFLKGWRAFL